MADGFSDYKSLDFLTLNTRREATENEICSRAENWKLVNEQNVVKANYLCSGDLTRPKDKGVVSQKEIFSAQLRKYVLPTESVSILSAFPLFLYEYFPA